MERKRNGVEQRQHLSWAGSPERQPELFISWTTQRANTVPGQAPSCCQQHCLPAVSTASDAPVLLICFKIRPDATRHLQQPLLPLFPNSCTLSFFDPFRLHKILVSGNSGNLKGGLDKWNLITAHFSSKLLICTSQSQESWLIKYLLIWPWAWKQLSYTKCHSIFCEDSHFWIISTPTVP